MPRVKLPPKKTVKPKTKKPVKKVSKVRADGLSVGVPFPKRPPIGSELTQLPGFFELTSKNAVKNIAAETWTAFLRRLSETGHVANSCKDVGLNRVTAYARKLEDSDFADAWEAAHNIGFSVLQDEAKRRAYEGIKKGIYYQGELVATELEYSDQLLMFLMQGNDSRYKRKQEITGADGGALLMLAKLDDDGLDDLINAKLKELQAVDKA